MLNYFPLKRIPGRELLLEHLNYLHLNSHSFNPPINRSYNQPYHLGLAEFAESVQGPASDHVKLSFGDVERTDASTEVFYVSLDVEILHRFVRDLDHLENAQFLKKLNWNSCISVFLSYLKLGKYKDNKLRS